MARDYQTDPQLSVEEAKSGIANYLRRAAKAPFKVANAILPLGAIGEAAKNTTIGAVNAMMPTPSRSGADPAYGIAKAPTIIQQAVQQPEKYDTLRSVNDPRRGTQAPGAAPLNYNNAMSKGSGSLTGRGITQFTPQQQVIQAPKRQMQSIQQLNAPSGLATPNPVFSKSDIADMTPTQTPTNAGGAAMALGLTKLRGRMNQANNNQALGIYNAQSDNADRVAGQGIAQQKNALETYDSLGRREAQQQSIAQSVQTMGAERLKIAEQQYLQGLHTQLAALPANDPKRTALIQKIHDLSGPVGEQYKFEQVKGTDPTGMIPTQDIVRINTQTGQAEKLNLGVPKTQIQHGAPVAISTAEQLAALPSGTQYTAPDGTTRIKR